MSLRGYKVYSVPRSNSLNYRILVESPNNSSFLYVENNIIVTLASDVGESLKKTSNKIMDGCGLMGILKLCNNGLEESYIIVITEVKMVGKLNDSDICKISSVKFISLTHEPMIITDERVPELARLLSSENFYFAYSSSQGKIFDLTLPTQRTYDDQSDDYRFFWNRNLYFPLERFGIDADDWFVRCMCGSVFIRTIYVGHRTAKVALISRLSCERVGTRFNVRGANDDGQVANFVETEQLISFENQVSSFVQIRGSVPLYWEQPGIQVGSHSIRLRSIEASLPVLERHYLQLKRLYGAVTTVNLLGSKTDERKLSEAFKTLLKNSSHNDTEMICFDYHAQMKISKSSIKSLQSKLNDEVDRYCTFLSSDGSVDRSQNGIIRTNCLDCLDRTNCVQTLIGMKALSIQLQELDVEKYKSGISSRFEETLKEIWQKNGDQCSVIYAGTGALEGKSKFKDASRSIARTVQNNLMDSSKQESFDLFLLGCGYFDSEFEKAIRFFPTQLMKECPMALTELLARRQEMANRSKLNVFVGTWNVNGGKNLNNVAFKHEKSFEQWFVNTAGTTVSPFDIVAIGLEEIVDLNASNLMKASTTNQRIFCEEIKQVLNEKFNEKYIVIGCEQLVGVCLMIYVRVHLLPRLRNFSMSNLKTGLGGTTGNKGSVAARMNIDATSVCFICSHFAAGQHEVINRNEDFLATIRKLRFNQGRSIESHDLIIWLGDFNYRISLSGADIKKAVEKNDLSYLVSYDQLTEQRLEKKVFMDFQEGPINFAPTYKYDTFSDDYDTSEKCRAPAWTDRILWRDASSDELIKLVDYRRSEIRTSDHRPVLAVFELNVLQTNLEKCQKIFHDVLSSLGPPDCIVLCRFEGYDVFPLDFKTLVLQKLSTLDIQYSLAICEGPILMIGFANGSDTLVALSMDGIEFDSKHRLSVQLRSPDWEEDWGSRMAPAFQRVNSCINLTGIDGLSTVNFNTDDDEEDVINSARTVQDNFIPPPCQPDDETASQTSTVLPTPLCPPRPSNLPPRPETLNSMRAPIVPPRPSPVNWPPRLN